MATAPEGPALRADQACGACKKQKRRCDKAVPECSLCQRAGRVCIYPDALEPLPTAAMFVALRTRLSELEQHVNKPSSTYASDASSPAASHHSVSDGGAARNFKSTTLPTTPSTLSGQQEPEFPAALFLDIDCFTWAELKLPDPAVSIPVEVLTLLTHGNFVVETSTEYFDTIHVWMPIVSKKRMDLGISVRNGGPDIAMLFLAMKLITAQADEVADSKLYYLAKGFLSIFEGSGFVSLLCLQSMVLIALYEYSHSIYPAAWMTVGACSRYAEILMLSCGEMNVSVMRQVTTWTEVEERRRVWWAIFILDRLVSMGSRRACSVVEPPSDGKLPVDDEAWETGDVSRAWGLSMCIDYQVHQSSYARLCQAAIYVGRAEAHARKAHPMSSSYISDTMSLADELNSFSAVLYKTPGLSNTDGFIRLLAPRCLIHSALFIALDSYTCPEKVLSGAGYIVSSGAKSPEELNMQSRSTLAIRQVSKQAHDLAIELSARIELDESLRWHLGKISPFMLDQMYCSIATLYWLLGENGDGAHQLSLKDMKLCMGLLGKRWRLSKKYLEVASFHNRTSNNSEN